MRKTIALGFTISLVVIGSANASGDKASCPMHAQHMAAAKADAEKKVQADGSAEHGRHVDSRHDTFGMAHDQSTHSFRLFAHGGAIELRANDAADAATAGAIRSHLEEITRQFKNADFSTPAFVHGYRPDGVSEIERLRGEISYRYERVDAGGRIRITTKSAAALAAIHDFLRFQVVEHRTANTGKVEEEN